MDRRSREELQDRMAAEFALGTLSRRVHRRFEARVERDPALARAVARWHWKLLPLALRVRPLAPPPALWPRIEARLFEAPRPSDAAVTRRGWLRWFAPLPAGALAAGLAAGLLLPTLRDGEPAADGPLLPESYVGVLAGPDGRPGLAVSSRRHGRAMDLKRLAPPAALPPGRTLVLWTIDEAGRVRRVGPVPPLDGAAFVRAALPDEADRLFADAVELAVSAEAAADATQPAVPFVFRGLCGRLWPPPRR